MRILVSGGGTAGHITPILAVANALHSLDKSIEILYVGTAGGMEAKIAEAAGLKFTSISAGKFRRYVGRSWWGTVSDVSTLFLNIRDAFRVVRGIWQSYGIIRQFRPNVVFVKGGYVGMPVGLAARLLRVPYVIHESDIDPGLTNRTLAKHAEAIATGFPVEKYKTLPKDKLVYTGSPIRQEVVKAHALEGRQHFDLDQKLPVILVIGGSQGAMRINDVVVDSLPELTRKYQIIHLTGDRDIERVRFEVKRLGLEHPEHYHPYSFLLKELASAMAVADLVISRAGANTIAELAVLGKPTILIPHPNLSGGHQITNATTLARTGAVKVLPEDRLTYRSLTALVDQILGSPEEAAYLSKAIGEFAVPDAADRLAKVIMEHARLDEPHHVRMP